MTIDEIEKCRNLLIRIESSLEKAKILDKIIAKLSIMQFNRAFEVKDLEFSGKNIDFLRQNLIMNILENQLKEIEISISKIGNLHQLLESRRKLTARQKNLR